MNTDGPLPKTRWTAERVARLGFLIGLGWDAKRVSEDPVISSTSNNVHRQGAAFSVSPFAPCLSRRCACRRMPPCFMTPPLQSAA